MAMISSGVSGFALSGRISNGSVFHSMSSSSSTNGVHVVQGCAQTRLNFASDGVTGCAPGCGLRCKIVLDRSIVGVGRPLGMLMIAVSRHRRLRCQLCQLHRCLREWTWRSLGQPAQIEQKWCVVKRPARMERSLCSRVPRHPERMGFSMKQLDQWNQAEMIMYLWMMLASTCDCTRQTAYIYCDSARTELKM